MLLLRLKKNQLLGPFRTESNTYLLMEVSGWIDQPVITVEEKQLRWADTKDRISETAAKKLYFDYVKKLMSGYQMKLNKLKAQLILQRLFWLLTLLQDK